MRHITLLKPKNLDRDTPICSELLEGKGSREEATASAQFSRKMLGLRLKMKRLTIKLVFSNEGFSVKY